MPVRHHPSALRNKEPIREVVSKYLKAGMKVLEIASGTGTHVSHMAAGIPGVTWQPSELDPGRLVDIADAAAEAGVADRVRKPVSIDISKPLEGQIDTGEKYDAVFNSNMVHISPYKCAKGLFDAAGKVLKPGTGRLIMYGPFGFDGIITPESNVNFDLSLRSQNPEWGIRDVTRELAGEANRNGLKLEATHDMPANNKILVWTNSDQMH